MKKIYFLSLNDGKTEGGATVRIKGILNSLAKRGYHVFFFSNIQDTHNYHPSITHLKLNIYQTPKDKKIFQLFIAFFGYRITNLFFSHWLNNFKQIFKEFEIDNLITFEYLDNSVGYWLWKNNIVPDYSNDIHGVADLEFKKAYKIAPFHLKPWFYLKLLTARKLDRKVISHAKFNIFTSKVMLSYFSTFIKKLSTENAIVIPNLINPDNYKTCINLNEVKNLPSLKGIDFSKKTIFFVGSFKKTSGVLQLINVVRSLEKDVNLIMVGDGPLFENCYSIITKENLTNIYLLGRLPYDYLNCFHTLADIMVCPDEDNPFSHMIVHLKYLDALMSNKPVINANFKSVLELNIDEELSIGYPPSNYNILEEKIRTIIDNYTYYENKYKNNRGLIASKLSYDNYIINLIKKF